MLTKILMVSAVVTVLTASAALAAPFCAVFVWGKQCDYGTYEECLRAAGSSGGCEFNSQEDKPAPARTILLGDPLRDTMHLRRCSGMPYDCLVRKF